MADRPLRLPPSSSENSSSSTKRTLKERVRNALITGTAGGYLGGMLVPEGKVRVKVPALLRKALKMKRRKTVGIHGARAGVLAGALIGGRNKGERSETVDAVATGGDWKFEERKPLTPGQKAALAGGGVLTAGGLVLGTARGRNALRSAMAGGSALGGLLNKAPGGQPRRVRMMKVQQKRKDLSNVRAANKAVEGARAKFRAEALPKAPAEPTLGDAVKTVKKRMKRKVVKAVSNIGANPAETQLSAFIEDMTFSGLPKEVQKDVLRFVDAEKGTPMVHYGMTVKELIGKADPENLKAARKALGTLRASRAADEVMGKIKDGSKYVLLMNDRIVDGHHHLAKAERAGVTSSLNVLDLTPARLSTRQMSANAMLLNLFEEARERRNRTRDLRDRIGLAKDVAGLGVVTGAGVGGVKLYRAAKKGIQQAAPQVKAAARAWHRAGVKTGKTLDTVKDAVAPAAATNRGIKAVGSKIGAIARKATMWMHDDPRPVRQFQVSGSKFQEEKRSKMQNLRDAALTAAGATVAGVGVAGALKAREAGKVADNIRNTTAIGADVGKVYRKARKVVTDSADAFKGGLREAAGKPAPSWAKKAVRVGKKLRLLESRVPSFKFQVSSSKARMNEFIIGALGTIAGTLAGSAAGNKFRYPVQNALKKRLVPKLGVKWGRRVARSGAYIPENAGALAGGAAGSLLTGGMRKRKAEEEQFQVPSSKFQVSEFNARALRALHEFGGREQLKDIDSSGFLDPLDVFVGRKKGYTAEQVKDYNRQKRYISDVKSGKRKGTAATVQAAEDLMAQIRGNPSKAAHGQVVRSVLRKGDDVRRVAERGGGLMRDAAKELRGEGREKDPWGREKKREWEKPWFQRTKNQVIGAAALGGGALLLQKNPRLRAGMDRTVRLAKRKVNSYVADTFPDVKPLRKKGQKTAATVQAKQQQAAQAKATKTQAQVAQAAQSIAAQAAAVKKAKPAAAPAAKSPAPVKPAVAPAAKSPAPVKPAAAPAAVKPAAAPVLRTAAAVPQKKAASKPAGVKKAPAAPQVKAAPKPQAPPANTQEFPGSAWGASKLANEPKPLTAAEKAAKPKPKPKGRGKNQFEAAVRDLLTQFAEKPFDGYNSKRHARTGGLNDSFRKSYNRQHGANLKRPVTTKPSKLKAGSEAAGRRKSFCARMGGMPGATSKGGKLTPKGAALQRWNCMAIQALTQFADPLDVGWDIRDARGNSARVFAPQAGQRDRRPKRWHERVENERKLWAGAALTSTLAGGAAMRKLLGRQSDKAVKEALKRQAQQIGTAVKKRYVKKAASGGGGKAPNVVRFDPAA